MHVFYYGWSLDGGGDWLVIDWLLIILIGCGDWHMNAKLIKFANITTKWLIRLIKVVKIGVRKIYSKRM